MPELTPHYILTGFDLESRQYTSVAYEENTLASRKSVFFNFKAGLMTQVEEFTPMVSRMMGEPMPPTALVGNLIETEDGKVSATVPIDDQIVKKAHSLYKASLKV
jgi:hypothetical protein